VKYDIHTVHTNIDKIIEPR